MKLYPSEHFSNARSALMLPHPEGEAKSIVDAFIECQIALNNFAEDLHDDNSRRWVTRLNEFMNTEGLESQNGKGLWLVKARMLTTDEKYELSDIIDELASWCETMSNEDI